MEAIVDKAIEKAIDQAVQILTKEKKISPFSFLVHTDSCITSVMPIEKDYYMDEGVMVDSFKSFGNEKLNETNVEGFSVVYQSKTMLKGNEIEVIVVFCKFKNDILPLKTRIYYFPFTFWEQQPFIDFESAFASEN